MKGKKFKKLISLLLALIMLLTVVPATVSAVAAEEVTVLTAKISEAVETSGKNLFASASEAVQTAGEKLKSVMNLSSNNGFEYTVLEDGTAEITNYYGIGSNLAIPSEIDGYKVTSLGVRAFNGDPIKSVTIPNSVTNIGEEAFQNCDSLKSINIPDSVTRIEPSTFINCSSLTSISIPNSVETIGVRAFGNCSSLKNIIIPNSVISIEHSAFVNCESLTSIKLSNRITNISDWMFEGCTSLESISIPDGVVRIGMDAFRNCTSLVNINMPDSVEEMGGSAFYGCGFKNINLSESLTYIGANAFYLCTSLTNITIPGSVKEIEENAFNSCFSLTDIKLSNGITSIKKYAFSGCTSLVSVIIPNSVTSIESPAFDACKSLKSIKVNAGNVYYCDIDGVLFNRSKTEIIKYPEGKKEETYDIPKSVKRIEKAAFSGSTSLNSINIPDSVTSIEEYAFSGCKSLTDFKIPDSVSWIYEGAFQDCASLKKIAIPDGVSTIDMSMFSRCKSLASITIPESVNTIEFAAFNECLGLTDIYYTGTKQQWDNINIDEALNECLLNATLHFVIKVHAGSLRKGSVGFTVFDKSYFFESSRGDVNKTLQDVTVTAGNYEEKFNDFLIVDNIPKDAGVTFTKDGYNEYIIPSQVAKALFSSDKGQQFNVYMTKSPGDGKPYVSTVFVKNSDDEEYTEVQMSSAVASKGNKYDIVMSAGNVSGDVTYYLSQDSNHRLFSKTGVFSAVDIVSKFNAGQDIYAYVQNGSQTSEPIKIKLEIANINIPDGTLSLIGEDRFKIKAGEGVPLVGGMEISFDGFDKIPIGVDLSGNMLKLSFGVDLRKSNSESEFKDDEWSKYKKTVSTIFSEKKPKEKKEQWDKYCELLTGNSVQSSKSKDFDIRLLGYAEGYIVGNELLFTDTCGEIVGMFSFTYNHQGVMLSAGIPYYVYLKAGADIGAKFTAIRHLPDNNVPLDFGIKINFEPALTIGGGVGVKDAISAGLYGKGAFPMSLDLSKKYGDIDMTGEVGVEGQFLWYKGEKTIYEGTVHIWEGYLGTKKEASLAKLNAVTDKLREENEKKTETTVISRDYLQYTSDWKGGNIFTRLFSSRAVSEGVEIKDLQTSVYNNSETQLVSLDDGRMMMAWIEDDADRDEYNRLRLMYSVWENGVWSEPKAVSDSGTTDSAPSLATDGKNVYVAWQNVNYKMSQADADPIAKVLEKTEIKFAQYDSEKDEFINVKTLTDNSGYDYMPTAAAENGECVVYWLSNSGNNLTVENSNTLHKYSLSSGKTDTVKSGMNNILGIDAIVKDGESEISYAMDTDGNLATTEDIKAFTLKNGDQIQLSPESEEVKNADFAVAYGKLNGNDTVFFADNSNIYYRENGEVKSIFTSIRSINGDLQVLDNAEETTLMWSEITDAGTDLWVCSYSNGEWNEPVQVTDTGKLLHNISAVYHDGVIRGVLNRTDRLIKDGEYVNGATDLCALTLSDFTELEAGFVAVDESQFVKGKETDLSVYLKNNGTKDIEKVKITLSDTLSTDITVEETVNLKSGEEKLITVKYLVPENYGRTDLTVRAVVPGEEEIDENDNEDTVSVGFADISISDMKVEDVGRFYILTAILSNDNQTIAENVKVEVREGNKDGNVVDTVEVGTLEPETVKSIQYIVDKTAVDYDGEELGHIYFAAMVEEPAVQSRAAKTEPTEKITEDNFVGAVFEYTSPETEPEPETKPGDINGDGQVTAVDTRWVLQIAAGTREVTEEEREAVDLNKDGKVTAVDARWVLQIAAGTRVA